MLARRVLIANVFKVLLVTNSPLQNVFAAFASVAFVKLIIFSVFEMRYLLIIWKARRPQGFAEGWLSLRRELTTLYSRFYLSLLAGLCLFYNFSVRRMSTSTCVYCWYV